MDLPAAPDSADLAPFILTRPERHLTPLVFVSAHSGRAYPPELTSVSRLDIMALRRSEDSFVDELFDSAPDAGAPLLAATFPRAFCDPNREPWELDPAMFEGDLPPWVNSGSPRVSAGLGTIARVVSSGEPIYSRKLLFTEAERRIRQYWVPFHRALASLIVETQSTFGGCLLIDCHSMPAISCAGRTHARHGLRVGTGVGGSDIVLGDAFGTACAPIVSAWAETALRDLGYAVRRNDPYAGGYITRHYGAPRDGIHALQIEINRSLYMDETSFERAAGFGALRSDMAALTAALAGAAPRLIGRA